MAPQNQDPTDRAIGRRDLLKVAGVAGAALVVGSGSAA